MGSRGGGGGRENCLVGEGGEKKRGGVSRRTGFGEETGKGIRMGGRGER